ncbi:MAG: aminotransferase class V-fold PLP-dependent enzyme [Alphaproteobacteria bacterium]|nr:aminotransferase class V-fold PLP-dependent enzyme [Alphaproteobacteria bacterium]
MLSFDCDYVAGAHSEVLKKLVETNMKPLSGYGEDIYCKSAREKIKKACNCENADVYFLVGGTQANLAIISSLLDSYEGVISADTGHVNGHEAGAIEHTGHKVIALPNHEGKISAEEIEKYIKTFYENDSHSHMVFPGMVYISYPTEYGTLYSKNELEKISAVCKKYEIPFFIDGARLGYGLMSKESDVTLCDIAKLYDVFYIGGTKVGALCGEAVVFTKNNAPKNFVTRIKQHGALLAKGRLLGVQFDALFSNNLYFEISKHAIQMAEKLKSVLTGKGYQFFLESPTNQQFVILENSKMEELRKNISFCFWEKYDETRSVVRFATSWSTAEADIEALKTFL